MMKNCIRSEMLVYTAVSRLKAVQRGILYYFLKRVENL
ncbi:hypothetical protein Nmel_008019 [Mimus melanotis]